MKKMLWLIALLAISVLTLTGCNKTAAPVENPWEENVEIANPASVYCEEQWGTLVLEEGSWICMFEDGSYCEEWSYFRNECQPGEIFYNTISEDEFIDNVEYKVDWNGSSEVFSHEDLQAAVDAIMHTVNNEWEVSVEMQEIFYAWDEISADNLPYCQNLNPSVSECVVFTSNFFVPEQDVQMAWAFEPNTNIVWWGWTLGKNAAGEWEVLTNGFG